jgi:DNA mismatch endonuclease (patch repair protein)
LVFPSRKAVIFVHGCFWHQHPDPECKDARPPKSRQEYWAPKLLRNIERDKAAMRKLQAMGWRTMTVWECEIQDADALARRIQEFVSADLCKSNQPATD